MTQTMGNWTHRGVLYTEGNTTGELAVDATPRKVEALASQGVESGLTVDELNSQITIAVAGDYMVTATVSFNGSQSKTFKIAIYKNGVSTGYTLERKLGTGGDVGSAAVSGIITCAATDNLSLYQSSADGGTAMTITNAQLSVVRLS